MRRPSRTGALCPRFEFEPIRDPARVKRHGPTRRATRSRARLSRKTNGLNGSTVTAISSRHARRNSRDESADDEDQDDRDEERRDNPQRSDPFARFSPLGRGSGASSAAIDDRGDRCRPRVRPGNEPTDRRDGDDATRKTLSFDSPFPRPILEFRDEVGRLGFRQTVTERRPMQHAFGVASVQ